MMRKRKKHTRCRKDRQRIMLSPPSSSLSLSFSPVPSSPRLFHARTFTINGDISSRGRIPRGRSPMLHTPFSITATMVVMAAAVTTDCNEIFDRLRDVEWRRCAFFQYIFLIFLIFFPRLSLREGHINLHLKY